MKLKSVVVMVITIVVLSVLLRFYLLWPANMKMHKYHALLCIGYTT